MNSPDDDRAVRVVVKNGTTKPTRLFLRPWGSYYEMGVGESYEVRASGPSTGALSVTQVEGGAIVTGWRGCVLSVHTVGHDGASETVDVACITVPRIELCQELAAAQAKPEDEDAPPS